MNVITSVVRADGGEKRISKNFEVAVSEKEARITSANRIFEVRQNTFAVIPPLTEYAVDRAAVIITVDKAVLPLKEITVIEDTRGEVYKIAEQAQIYINSKLPKKQLILSALGGLLVAWLKLLKVRRERSG